MNTSLLTDSVLSKCKSQVGDENLGSCETFAVGGLFSMISLKSKGTRYFCKVYYAKGTAKQSSCVYSHNYQVRIQHV